MKTFLKAAKDQVRRSHLQQSLLLLSLSLSAHFLGLKNCGKKLTGNTGYSSYTVNKVEGCLLKKYFVRITQYCGFQNYICVFCFCKKLDLFHWACLMTEE